MRTKNPDSLYIRAPRLNQLNILNQLKSNARLTQAELARRCGLSVAMVNNYMKELCSMGLLEYHRRSSKSVTYHLTATGEFHLKTILQELVGETLDLFCQSKEWIKSFILGEAGVVIRRVVLYGCGDLAQLTFHALESAEVGVVGICDDDPANIGREFCGREILNPSQIRYVAPDAIVVVDYERADEICVSLNALEFRGVRVICLRTGALDGQTVPGFPGRSKYGISFQANEVGNI